MLKNRGIAFKLVLFILFSEIAIFTFIFGYNYLVSRRIIEKNIEQNARNLVMATVNRIDSALRAVEKIPKNLLYILEDLPLTGVEVKDLLRTVVENNPDIYGAAIALEPYAYSKDKLCFAPYYCRSGGKLKFTYLDCDSYTWDWYRIPKEVNHAVWSEPYYDEGAGNRMMSTFSVPFYKSVKGKKRFMGVITADISLTWLKKIVSSIKIAQTGYGFLISKNGRFVTHPQTNLIMNETVFSVAKATNNINLQKIGREMTEGKSGFAPFTSMRTGKKCWIGYAPLSTSNWSLGILFPQDELMSDITDLNHAVWALSVGGFLILMVVIIIIAGSITRPLRALSKATEGIATGDLDVELPQIRSQDEVGVLAESFKQMEDSLKQYIKDLTETTAAKERIESELYVARDIQMGMLPTVPPPFPDIALFDIYATLEPAREVGGDLYNFFFMDDDHLCFAVGDVAGKGVPAALFMTVTQTLIKTKGIKGLSPGEILESVNKDLSLENPSFMFVTLFVGILHIRTGALQFSSGGHNPPYIIRADGKIEAMELTGGIPLGIVEDFSYQSKMTGLKKDDTIFLYTDGVTEAMNEKHELFSSARLEEDLLGLKDKPVEQMAGGIMESIEAFSRGTPQTDDITILLLRFYGEAG